MVGAMLSSNDNEEGERKKKKIKKEQQQEKELLLLPYLDENICTEILIRVPVESLFNSFRYVCKSWLNIITNHPSNFPLNHLRSKPPCLIIQQVKYLRNSHEELRAEAEEAEEAEEEDFTCTTSFIKMGKQGIEKQFDITPIFKKLRIRACCNGLILVSPELKHISTLYVVNPLTNHQVMLPPHPLESDSPCSIKFIFIHSTREYRVVMGGFRPGNEILQPKHYIQILTLSAEDCFSSSSSSYSSSSFSHDDCDLPRREWRIIEVPEQQFMHQAGHFHWICRHRKHITFDVVTEKFYEFPYPVYHGHQEIVSGFMKMGGFLTSWVLGLLHRCDDALTLSVCVLKDFHTGIWIHQYSVRIDPDFLNPKDVYFGHHPVLSSGSDEVIIFQNCTHKTLWAYNVESHQSWEVGTNLKEWDDICFYDFHVNKNETLESLYSN